MPSPSGNSCARSRSRCLRLRRECRQVFLLLGAAHQKQEEDIVARTVAAIAVMVRSFRKRTDCPYRCCWADATKIRTEFVVISRKHQQQSMDLHSYANRGYRTRVRDARMGDFSPLGRRIILCSTSGPNFSSRILSLDAGNCG